VRPDELRDLYRGGRPNDRAKAIQARFMRIARLGIVPIAGVLEVVGRRTGTVSRLPLAVAWYGGHRYLVAMLGPSTNWVRNVEASGGRAVWEQGTRRHVTLVPVPVEQRAPILRRYLLTAWSARPHLAVRWNAPLADFEAVADQYPVYRISRAATGGQALP
jgi:hypothetical protein